MGTGINDKLFDEGGAVYNVQSTMFGGGIGTDGTQLYGILTAVLKSSASVVIPEGTYNFNTSGEIPAGVSLQIEEGAVFKPAPAQIVTISGSIEAGDFAWIDLSSGGNVIFAGPTSVIPAVWFREITTASWTPPVPKTPVVRDAMPNGGLYSAGSIAAGNRVIGVTTRWSKDASGVSRETGPSDAAGVAGQVKSVNTGMFGIVPEDPGCGLENGETGIATGWSAYLADLDTSTTVGTPAPASAAVTINLSAVNDMPSSGYVKIDSEIIQYSGLNFGPPGLTGCTRGSQGTTAAAHSVGAAVKLVQTARSAQAHRTPSRRRSMWVPHISCRRAVMR